jgi:ribosomal protein S18 acetylase RimI-like enzyme
MPNFKPSSGLAKAAGVCLRPATSADIPLITAMHVQSWVATYRGILPDAYLEGDVRAEREAHWRLRAKDLDAGAASVLIAEHGGAAVGFICLIAPDEHGSVLVDNLHALPGHKGLGIGTTMLDEAARWARARGARELYLSVLEGNDAAIGFYESHGWQRTTREADHVGGIDLFAFRYALPLDQGMPHRSMQPILTKSSDHKHASSSISIPVKKR